ncbi:hypothetical protein [Dactylosporangium sp. CA-092794]|uniref:hypothetical protein n=1 Tax=Dactylosporangium sp. CA-092794 TaxID=3239929 RepID=UPI003D9096D6
MLFNPAANLIGAEDAELGLRVIAGDVAVGQVCCDPATFVEVTNLVVPHGGRTVEELVLDARVRALLRVVWPGRPAQARLAWGGRVAAQARRHHSVDDLVAAVVGDVIGVPPGVLREVLAESPAAGRFCPDPVVRAGVPMALLRTATAEVVRKAAGGPDTGAPDTVLDELLFWRGLGHEPVSLDDVATLVTALTAAAWDATRVLLSRPADADDPAPPGAGHEAIGWLRVATQSVMLGGAPVPAGTRCLLLVDATEPEAHPARPPLHTLRWLAPAATDGAGATFARLVADEVLAAGHHLRDESPGSASRAFSPSAQPSSAWALPAA